MKTKPWIMYLVENKLGQLYCGISNDLLRRFSEHQNNGKRCAKALRGKGPLILRFAATLENHSLALQCEHWVKRLTRNEKEAIISGTKALPFSHVTISSDNLHKIMKSSDP